MRPTSSGSAPERRGAAAAAGAAALGALTVAAVAGPAASGWTAAVVFYAAAQTVRWLRLLILAGPGLRARGTLLLALWTGAGISALAPWKLGSPVVLAQLASGTGSWRRAVAITAGARLFDAAVLGSLLLGLAVAAPAATAAARPVLGLAILVAALGAVLLLGARESLRDLRRRLVAHGDGGRRDVLLLEAVCVAQDVTSFLRDACLRRPWSALCLSAAVWLLEGLALASLWSGGPADPAAIAEAGAVLLGGLLQNGFALDSLAQTAPPPPTGVLVAAYAGLVTRTGLAFGAAAAILWCRATLRRRRRARAQA